MRIADSNYGKLREPRKQDLLAGFKVTDSLTSPVTGENHVAVVRCGIVSIRETLCGWLDDRGVRQDPSARRAEVFIADLTDDSVGHSVCNVYHERIGYGHEAAMHTRINWSAWGAQDLETTRRVAYALRVATALGEAFDEGFTFLRNA